MSLQDQLLKAGLVDKNKVRKAKQAKHKQIKQKKPTTDEAKLAAERARAEKVERDRQLNLERKQEAEQRAVAAQIRQLIEMNRQERNKGEIPFNFVDGSTITHIYVDETQQRQLGRGRLAIVRLDGGYEIVPAAVSEKIALRDGSYLVHCSQDEGPADTDEEDPYADYQVPDDLMW